MKVDEKVKTEQDEQKQTKGPAQIGAEEVVSQAGAIWKGDEAIVVDGALYSSAGGEALEAFSDTFVEAIAMGAVEESEAA